MRLHIARGDDLNARDVNGMTPLMLSAARNRSDICSLLLAAGADPRLLAPSGQTAHEIAVAAGAHETAEILSMVQASPPISGGGSKAFTIEPGSRPGVEVRPADARPAHLALGTLPAAGIPLGKPPVLHAADVTVDLDGPSEFDLSGWEAEEESSPPETDLSIVRDSTAIQVAISKHETVDSSAEWSDIDVDLPIQASPFARAGNVEARARLRPLLLRAIREGSVPSRALAELSTSYDDQSLNLEAVARLRRVINDLGADVDERLEYLAAADSFEVILNPEETPEEEDAVDEALAAIESAESSRNEPLQIYLRELRRFRLMSALDEVALSQAMEMALQAALDALAAWPGGVAWTLAVGAEIKAGVRPLAWMSLGSRSAELVISEDPRAEALAAGEEEEPLAGDLVPRSDAQFHLVDSGFTDALRQLGASSVDSELHTPAWRAVREALAALRLSRRFMLELSDIECPDSSSARARYVQAMSSYRQERDRMAAANLRLVFHLAKKYLYSGEPLDDLIQAGNIGLLKAVERFDWRRGFRFTTYATWWIRQQIGRHIADKGRTIRIPVHVYEKYQRLSRETEVFESRFGRAPSPEELAAGVGIPAEKVAALRRVTSEILSIEALSTDELATIEALDIFRIPDPVEIVTSAELHRLLDDLLSVLSPRDRMILRLRYGFGVRDSLTLDEIGQRFAFTRERIRQIEASALKKLRVRVSTNTRERTKPLIQTARNGRQRGGRCGEERGERERIEVHDRSEKSRPQGLPVSASAVSNVAARARSSRLDQLLAHAAALGVAVDDERGGHSGRIWVRVRNIEDSRYRHLVRRLIDFGFAPWPGEGYWK
ncbi:RNA polymerase primary sigma factor [Quisquiliibacterium transsilvanicum]|uniref:RNA polymerase sigma factor n=1 Tax=Quisquiliibacterium transsilvanicum TaxID=1549638 RepID=A0A7W8HHD4_9BURK|nr:RNA polymerase primary sigma factor [Quisquiliibacterium transsilvanicum]